MFFKIKSYAKINLALNITGKKKSLHKIESIIAFVIYMMKYLLKKLNQKNIKFFLKENFQKI